MIFIFAVTFGKLVLEVQLDYRQYWNTNDQGLTKIKHL